MALGCRLHPAAKASTDVVPTIPGWSHNCVGVVSKPAFIASRNEHAPVRVAVHEVVEFVALCAVLSEKRIFDRTARYVAPPVPPPVSVAVPSSQKAVRMVAEGNG